MKMHPIESIRKLTKRLRTGLSRTDVPSGSETPLYFFNTLGREKQEFTLPSYASTVRMYNCGPTLYGRQHIGNLSMFVFTDTLRNTLEYNGFTVRQVINFTDFGHLSSDADEGEDKMTKGLKRDKLPLTLENMRALADKYAAIFLDDLRALNIDTARITFPYASEHVQAQIAMIKTLEEKSYAYKTSDGMYFDTSRFPAYGALGGIDLAGQKEGARVESNPEKRSATDFALWKFDKKLGWDSPWGKGFPGWHIECSAMIRRCLGEQIDIHTGGIEHIPVHHNNEIAQSEAATGKKPLSRFWLHRSHIQLEGGKLAKSEGRVVYLSDVIEKGFSPSALRYLFLGAHYRSSLNFSWDALQASATALSRLAAHAQEEGGSIPLSYQKRFHERMNDDLDTPGAIAVLWDMTKDQQLSKTDIAAGLRDADRILGLNISLIPTRSEIVDSDLPAEVQRRLAEREAARTAKNWSRSDELRDELGAIGYEVQDTADGQKIYKK